MLRNLLIWAFLMVNVAGVAFGEYVARPRFALPITLGVLVVGLALAWLFSLRGPRDGL